MAQKAELPVCHFCYQVGKENDRYCIRCGRPFKNQCSDGKSLIDKGCGAGNLPDAAFCAKCGSKTVYHKNGWI